LTKTSLFNIIILLKNLFLKGDRSLPYFPQIMTRSELIMKKTHLAFIYKSIKHEI